MQLIKQKDAGGGVRGGWKMRQTRETGWQLFHSASSPLITRTGKITRNQRRLETLRFYIVETIFERFEDISRENFLEREKERERDNLISQRI